MLNLTGWPRGIRVIVGKERPASCRPPFQAARG